MLFKLFGKFFRKLFFKATLWKLNSSVWAYLYIQSFWFSRVGDDAFDVEVIGKEELQSAAKLLGVSATMLIQGLTMRTHSVRGQAINSLTDSHQVLIMTRKFSAGNNRGVNLQNKSRKNGSYLFIPKTKCQ